MNEKETILSENMLFKDISGEKLSEVSEVVQKEVAPAHKMIFQQGDPGDKFYIITAGKVRIFRKSAEGVETDLSLLSPGDSFGEMALLTGKTRSANAEAVEETHFNVIEKKHFDRVLRNHPDVSLAFIKQMSDWLMRDEAMIEKEAERQTRAPRLSWLDFLVIIAVSLLCGITFNLVNPNGLKILPQSLAGESISSVSLSMALAKHKEGGAIFVDARPESFYKQGHIEDAVNMPAAIFDIMYMFELSDTDKRKDIIVYGRTLSSRYDNHVARKLILRGHNSTMILDANLKAWKKKGYSVKP